MEKEEGGVTEIENGGVFSRRSEEIRGNRTVDYGEYSEGVSECGFVSTQSARPELVQVIVLESSAETGRRENLQAETDSGDGVASPASDGGELAQRNPGSLVYRSVKRFEIFGQILG